MVNHNGSGLERVVGLGLRYLVAWCEFPSRWETLGIECCAAYMNEGQAALKLEAGLHLSLFTDRIRSDKNNGRRSTKI